MNKKNALMNHHRNHITNFTSIKYLKLLVLLNFILVNNLSAQTLTLKTNISSTLQETSGLLYLNGKLITHTDSGGEPALYEIDTATGTHTRKVLVQNATNNDWEDITMDNDFIYIGDFGNNQGNRTNLRIFKVAIQDYLTKDTVHADTILFHYADQVNFTPSNFTTNFDAEALISLGDSLYIFTKNWGDLRTNIYAIPKKTGQYSSNRIDSINAQGYITGAVCDSARNQILLIGYTFNTSFFLRINSWSTNFSTGSQVRGIIQPNSSIQIEGVAQIDSAHYYISSEKFQTSISQLHIFDYRFPVSNHDIIKKPSIVVFPNPATNFIYIRSKGEVEVRIYSAVGKIMHKSNKKIVHINALVSGIYFVFVQNGNDSYYQKLTVQ